MTKATRITIKNGRYYYIQDLDVRNPLTGKPKQKWHKLTRVDEGPAAMHEAVGQLLAEPVEALGKLPALIKDFSRVHFVTLDAGVKKEYERMFAVISKAFAEFNGPEISAGIIEEFLNNNFAGKLNTWGKYKARLSTFFSWCVRNSAKTGVTVNPCREIKAKKPPKQRGRLNAEIYWKLYDALTPMGQCFLELMYLTRQRPTEIRLLRESQIGPERIHFEPTKTINSSGEDLRLLITPEIRACLERARALRPKAGKVADLAKHRDPYIIQARDGDKYTKNGLYEVWRDACDAAGTKGVTTRHVRAYALSEMEKAGHGLREIQTAAVHSTSGTTEVYLDQYRERVSDARQLLPARPQK